MLNLAMQDSFDTYPEYPADYTEGVDSPPITSLPPVQTLQLPTGQIEIINAKSQAVKILAASILKLILENNLHFRNNTEFTNFFNRFIAPELVGTETDGTDIPDLWLSLVACEVAKGLQIQR